MNVVTKKAYKAAYKAYRRSFVRALFKVNRMPEFDGGNFEQSDLIVWFFRRMTHQERENYFQSLDSEVVKKIESLLIIES